VVARRHASTSSVVRDDRGVSAVARERLDRSETRGASLPRLSRVQIFSSPKSEPRTTADPSSFPLSSEPQPQTGGAAIMRKGPNLLKLARKEQCLALLNSMRAKNKINGCIYRVFPSGEVQYLHPKDGVYPEKVNKGRVGVNNNMRSIGKNANPASIKFGGKLNADGLASDGAGFSRVFDQ
jgi:hypothetical protein